MGPKKRKPASKPSKSPPPAKRTRKASSAKEPTNPEPPSNDTKTIEDSTPNTSSPTSLTITSANVKNPIPCHFYPSPAPKASSSTPPSLIFTHGASGTLTTPALSNFCTGFSTLSSILAFKGNMNLAARVKAFHAILEHYDPKTKDSPKPALGGRSMGARAAVQTTLDILPSLKSPQLKLILVSYPLQSPKGDLRDQILLSLPASVSVLFIIGSKDTMCPLSTLSTVRQKMKAGSQLVVVRGADHGMHVAPKKAESGVGEMTGVVAGEWLESKGGEGKEMEIWWDEDGGKVDRGCWEEGAGRR